MSLPPSAASEILLRCELAPDARWSAWLKWLATSDTDTLRSGLGGLGVPPDAVEELVVLKQAGSEAPELRLDERTFGVVSDEDVAAQLERAATGVFNG